ncbi:hypothetical protein GCM10029992_38360 [Glycomyces albus]
MWTDRGLRPNNQPFNTLTDPTQLLLHWFGNQRLRSPTASEAPTYGIRQFWRVPSGHAPPLPDPNPALLRLPEVRTTRLRSPNTRLFEPKPPARWPSQTPVRPVAHPRPRNRPQDPRPPEDQPSIAYPPAPPRALSKRLTSTDQAELITAFNAGATQKTLAATYGISTRSIKRLVHGHSNRPQATTNRLTPDQRATIARTHATTGTTRAELARAYGVNISTIKRVLREHRET